MPTITSDTPGTRETRATGTWIPPLLSTLATLPLGYLALVYALLSPMVCDSCDREESRRFTESFMPAFWTVPGGLVLSLALLVTAWVLPRRVRHTRRRIQFAAAAPLTVVATWLLFVALVDWP
ncbi:hypothetical protein [Streptomyces sp. NRRL S-118]|uniref:hypothetical protein n=1 Tax=Streptomyces sp. NRRL S-118 TaxID=1463881 RepID=UPI0004C73E7F|nr:hypothetical protein [Streptomyces sp. NRRL S-118]